MKYWLILLLTVTFGLIVSTNVAASNTMYQVVYELDGGINNPNNPESYTENETFYFAEPFKEGYIFEGWYLESTFDTKVTYRPLPSSSTLTLYAKFIIPPMITVNPNNSVDPYDVSAATGIIRQTSQGYSRAAPTHVIHPLFSEDDLYYIYILNNDNSLRAMNLTTNVDFVLGVLPSNARRIYDIKVISDKIYGFASDGFFSGSNSVSVYAFEIQNSDETNNDQAFTNIVTASYSTPPGNQENMSIEVVDFENDGYYDIFIKWSRSDSNSYRLISFKFDHTLLEPTLTKNIEEQLQISSIGDLTFYDIDGDGTKEMVISHITFFVHKISIYQYNQANNNFELVKDFQTDSTSSRIHTNAARGGLLTVGTLLGGNKVYIAYFTNNSQTNAGSISYFEIDQDFNNVTSVDGKLANNLVMPSLGNTRMQAVQINEFGAHAFMISIGNSLGYHLYAYVPNSTSTGFIQLSNARETQVTSSSASHLSAMYFNNQGYIMNNNVQINVAKLNTFTSNTRLPNISVSKTGYTFDGWYLTEDFQNNTSIFAGKAISEDIDVFAKWTPRNYVMSFQSNGGTSVSQITVPYDSVPSEPTDPTRTHFQFLGWSSINNQSNREFFDFEANYTIANNTSLFAIWENETYTVKHETNSEDVIVDYEANSLSTYVLPNNLLKTGHDFGGWYTTSDFSGSAITQFSLNQTETTVYAKWNIQSFNIEFKLPNGDVYDTLTYTFGANISDYLEPAINPSVDGAVFLGWETTSLSSMPAEDISLNMLFDAIAYTVYFSVNEGVAMDQLVFDYASTIILNDATRLGYTFSGWFSDALLTNEFNLTTMPANDVTLYAKWTINPYTLTFNTDGGTTIAAITQNYATSITAPANPTRLGYTFDGWSLAVPETMPAEDLTLTATWLINRYTITFNSNEGTSVAAITQDYATTVTAPANPTRSGYTFSGWFRDTTLENAYTFTTLPAEDITLYAKWTINSYTLTFDAEGGSLVTAITQNYNTEVTAPEAPTRTGYTFSGWSETLPTTMPAENKTLTAIWNINSYTISFDSNGGSLITAITQNYNTEVTAPLSPTKMGYTFSGWSETLPTTMPAENKTLTATWTPMTYTITFNTNHGTRAQNQVSTFTIESSNVTLLDASRSGFVFKGWYVESTFDTKVTQIFSAEALSDITVYALFFSDNFQAYLDTIAEIPSQLSIEDKEMILELREAFDTYSTFEQRYVDLNRLDATLNEIKALEVSYVESLITSIPSLISYEDLESIKTAKEALDALDIDQQEDVTNQELLNTLLEILVVVEQIETLINSEDFDEVSYEALVLQFEALSEDQKNLIAEAVLLDYEVIQNQMSGNRIGVFIASALSLLFLILIVLWYVNKKRKALKQF